VSMRPSPEDLSWNHLLGAAQGGSLISTEEAVKHPSGARDPAEWAEIDRERAALRLIAIGMGVALFMAFIIFGIMLLW
jgi:hypothetical protein